MSTTLVTGGTGTIGSAIVEKLIQNPEHTVRVFSRTEDLQLEMKRRLDSPDNVRWLIGDVRDYGRLTFAMRDVDQVVHCAAMKHVLFCENNPGEALATNIIGTQNAIRAAIANDVKRFTLVSTDKAAYPSSTMGASKLMAERLVLDAPNYAGEGCGVFNIARLGNVFGSRGSIVPYLLRCASTGEPAKITSHEARRFFIMPENAAALIIGMVTGGSTQIIQVPTMGIIRLADLVTAVEKYTGAKIQEDFIPMQPGEKLHETSITSEETIHCDFFKTCDKEYGWAIRPFAPARATQQPAITTDQKTGLYTVEQIVEMLNQL